SVHFIEHATNYAQYQCTDVWRILKDRVPRLWLLGQSENELFKTPATRAGKPHAIDQHEGGGLAERIFLLASPDGGCGSHRIRCRSSFARGFGSGDFRFWGSLQSQARIE